jgi:hypothetical protein
MIGRKRRAALVSSLDWRWRWRWRWRLEEEEAPGLSPSPKPQEGGGRGPSAEAEGRGGGGPEVLDLGGRPPPPAPRGGHHPPWPTAHGHGPPVTNNRGVGGAGMGFLTYGQVTPLSGHTTGPRGVASGAEVEVAFWPGGRFGARGLGLAGAGAAAQVFFRTGRGSPGCEIKAGPWFCVSGPQ